MLKTHLARMILEQKAHPVRGEGRWQSVKYYMALLLRAMLQSHSTVGLMVVLLLSIGLWTATRTYMESVRWVDHSRAVLLEATRLQQSLLEAETAQRGYILTRNEEYLTPYRSAQGRVAESMDVLRGLVHDNPAQVRRIQNLEPVVAARLTVMQNVITLQQKEGDEVARGVMRDGMETRLMQNIRNTLAMFEQEESIMLSAREDRAQTLSWLLIIGVLGCAGILSGFVWFGLRNLEREREQDRLQAEELATALLEKEALVEQRDMLMAEMNHRVKNSLQQVGGMLRLQMRDLENAEAKAALTDALNRIMAIGKVHEQMYRSEAVGQVNASAFLTPLSQDVFGTLLEPKDGQLQVNIETLPLPLEKALSMALMVNELLTNAAKYAARKDQLCMVQLDLKKQGRGCRLRVSDNGPGMPKDFDIAKARSLGMRLIHNLSRQLGGTLAIKSGKNGGAVFDVVIPTL